MVSFTFFNPTTIEFGTDKEQVIGQHLATHGIERVLLIYGADRVKREKLFDVVGKRLAETGIELLECGDIVSDPFLPKLYEGIALARQHRVDAILSVGDASVLVSAKLIAAGVCYSGDVRDLFVGKAGIDSALPLFAILTVTIADNDMTPDAVAMNEYARQQFFMVYPSGAVGHPIALPKDV